MSETYTDKRAVAVQADPPPFVCPKHPTVVLQFVLRGGAGHCSRCSMFVQSVNHIEPLRDIPRPPMKAKAKKKNTTAKRKAARKKSTRSSKAHIIAA